MLQMELPKNIQREILATPIPLAARAEDKLAWKLSAKGDFDLKLAYSLTYRLAWRCLLGGSGFGNSTHCQESNPLFGSVCTTASVLGNASRLEVWI